MPSRNKTQAKGKAKESELVLARVFDAPRERVWRAWTEPEEFKRWWGPKGYTIPSCTIDFRVGGSFLYCMRSPDGKDYWATGAYREIVPLKKLVCTDSFANAKGDVVPASEYGMNADIPLEMLVTVTLENLGGKTKLTLRHAGIPVGPDLDGAQQGWSESFDKLAASLARGSSKSEFVTDRGMRKVIGSRVFNAPRERVFRTCTDPKLIPLWWGPRRLTTTVERMDVRAGGRWRFLQREPDGTEYAFRGEYKEVSPPERLVWTFEFEGMPGHILLETATFDEQDERTTMTVTAQFETVEDLDAMLQAGMTTGWEESDERLVELLETL